MKVLWITNIPLGILGERLNGKRSGGLWMSALLDEFALKKECELVVATAIPRVESIRAEENRVVYYGIPGQYPLLYKENDTKNIAAWETMLKQEKPDIIQVWGTEFTHGLCVLRLADTLNIPSVIHMQGYLGSITRHYLAGISHDELKKTVTFRDFIKHDSIEQQQKKYFASVSKEKEMLQLSGNIIYESDWCEDSVRAVVPNIVSYRRAESINKTFFGHSWSLDKAEPHTVMCTASGYPLKGLHMVLRAVSMLKEDYPDIKLYVPGTKMVSDGSLKWQIRKNGYTKYIEKLINELDLKKNIVWMGYVTQEQLAERLTKTRVFVLSSSIENHSNSLKEAMLVGTPSVASAVGGVPEYVRNGENGFLYRFEEYEIMAMHIKKLFEDDDLACKISKQSKEDMTKLHSGLDIYNKTMSIYRSILSSEKN